MDSKNSRKYLKIQLKNDTLTDINDLLGQIFWKEPKMVKNARDFLDYVKEWGRSESPYRVDEWENYCIRKGLTQSQYHNMLKRLRMAGMIKRTYNKNKGVHEIYLSENFSDLAYTMARIWDNYRDR